MKISKTKDTFNDYKIEQVSYRQLEELRDALKGRPGADADELRANLEWSLARLPKPGEEEEEPAKKDEAGGEVKPTPAPQAGGAGAGSEAGLGGEDDLGFEIVSQGKPLKPARPAPERELDVDLQLPDLPDPDEDRAGA